MSRRLAGCVLSAFLMTTLGAPPALDAESVGSPASILKKRQWAMGAGGGALLARKMKGDADVAVYQLGHFRGYGLTDWLSIYGKIGGASIKVDDPSIKRPTDSSTTHRFGLNVLSSVQLKGRIWQNAKQDWEWDGSVQYVDIRKRHTNRNEGRWHDWQFATSVAKSFGKLKPYLGVKYSMVNFTFKVRDQGTLIQQGKYKEDGPVGLFFGTDCYLGEEEDVVVNVESAYLDGAEVTVSVAHTF